MPAIYHEGSWLGNATDPEVLVKDTVGWTGKNRAYSQTNNAVIAHIENGITYDVSWTGSATVTLKKNSASGATITSGSTSPLSFTADADYELYFGSSATVTNIMVKDSRITDPTYEPYHESVEVMYEEEIHGVNLLKVTATTQTINGVTFTVNSDGSIKANGTAGEGNAYLNIITPGSNPLSAGTYKASGCPANGNLNTYILFFTNKENTNHYVQDSGNGGTFALNDDIQGMRCTIRIYAGYTANNLVFRPMLRKADIEDSTYRPYNYQAIQNQLNAQGVLGAKNLLKVTANTQTVNGVTFTVNRDSDGNLINITANGTASANTSYILRTKTPLAAGKSYIMSRGEVGDNDFQMVATAWNSGSYVKNIIEVGAGGYTEKSFVADYNGYNDIQISIFVRSGKTISNAKVYPMLRLASDPDDTYQPYAMTNRELTEKKINIADLKAVVSASSDFTDFKTRIASL